VTAVKPGDSIEVAGIKVQAVHAYNVVEERLQMHPKSNNWVGYVLTLGANTYYHAGDTDHAPELSDVRADVAFLPIGGTYTMDAGEAAGLAKAISPKLAVPMHYGFVVGSPSDAELFAKEADPVPVQTLTPTNPFER
jgi:L-ascorbate metabolism protein UlaG (beta-lactamase superfamily)